MTNKEEIIEHLNLIPTGNLPNDNRILAEALIYLIQDKSFVYR